MRVTLEPWTRARILSFQNLPLFVFGRAFLAASLDMASLNPVPLGKVDQPPLSEKGKAVRTLVEADLLDDRYATTQRGLKNRHVQLMALGGTIGTGEFRGLGLRW